MRNKFFLHHNLLIASAVVLLPVVILSPKNLMFGSTKEVRGLETIAPVKTATITVSPTITPTPHPKKYSELNDEPKLLLIPKVSLYAPIKSSDKTSDGSMEVPPDTKTVGWWKHGTFPGDIGSAVIAGHFKVDNGDAGVFFNLDQLSIGDEIFVILESGKSLVFKVSKAATYSASYFPLNDFFYANDNRRLNLITCAGKYVKESDKYSHRLAVYAELK